MHIQAAHHFPSLPLSIRYKQTLVWLDRELVVRAIFIARHRKKPTTHCGCGMGVRGLILLRRDVSSVQGAGSIIENMMPKIIVFLACVSESVEC